MHKAPALEDELGHRIEAALEISHDALEAITRVRETGALEGAMLHEISGLEDRIRGLDIFRAGEHIDLNQIARRLEPIIERATTVHYIADDSWDINPPHEVKTVEPYGMAAIDLSDSLQTLASRLRAVENLLNAEWLAVSLRERQD